jgi:glutathione S-transferase
MMVLYHLRDAICAQKVRIALAEKQLGFDSRLLQDGATMALRSNEYLALNRNGYVPTLVHDGRVLIESRIISEFLDAQYPDPPLHPQDAFGKYRVALWTKQIDDRLHLSIYILSFAIVFREARLALPAAERFARLPLTNPLKRDLTIQLTEQGFGAPALRDAIARFRTLLTDMEHSLADNPWLAAQTFTLADADLAPYLYRLDVLGVWPLVASQYPRVGDWYQRVRQRSSFQTGVLDWLDKETRERYKLAASRAATQLATLCGNACGPTGT